MPKSKYKTIDELPEDPFSMPPPYWRATSACFHINEGLSEIAEKLEKLVAEEEIKDERLESLFEESPDLLEDDEKLVQSTEFWEIVTPSAHLSDQIKLRVERTIVMAAIEVEDNINMVCVYNFRRELTEIIEKLSPLEKFVILGSILTDTNVKERAEFSYLQNLMKYRNAFAHGHNTDRPVKSLHHNHLIPPDEYPSLSEELEKLKVLINGFFCVNKFVRSMSKSEYAAADSLDEEDLKPIMEKILSYRFDNEP